MNPSKTTPEPEVLNCEVCLKEIPTSEAKSAEAEDYVAHFCGLECYEQWKARHQDESASQAAD